MTSGLIWQLDGEQRLTYGEIEEYVANLNQSRFAGQGDWRLPTIEEAMSVMSLQWKSALCILMLYLTSLYLQSVLLTAWSLRSIGWLATKTHQ